MKNMDFESAMKRLEEILGELGGQAVSMDRSLALYEEGFNLIQFCNEQLANTELKIKEIEKNDFAE